MADGLMPLRAGQHDGLQLWWTDLDRHPDVGVKGFLSAAERARAARFRFERDAARYATGRALLRALLAERQGCDPAAVTLETGLHGKPHVSGAAELQFNLSHSGPLALYAIGGSQPIGVDIESVEHVFDDFEATARTCFTAAELDELRAHPANERFRAFLRGWTRKEACLKALGTGLSVEPTRVDAGLRADRRELGIALHDGLCRLTVESIVEYDDFAAAFAIVHPASVHLAR